MDEDIIGLIAERKILAALEEGEFDNLPGKGKPLPPDAGAAVPAAERVGYRLLKSAGVLPPEMAVRQEIGALEQAVIAENRPAEKRCLAVRLAEKTAQYNIMMEKRRRK
jgi:hypothetical protein